jgi:hypothetical protein
LARYASYASRQVVARVQQALEQAHRSEEDKNVLWSARRRRRCHVHEFIQRHS